MSQLSRKLQYGAMRMVTLIKLRKYVYDIFNLWQGIRHHEKNGKFNTGLHT